MLIDIFIYLRLSLMFGFIPQILQRLHLYPTREPLAGLATGRIIPRLYDPLFEQWHTQNYEEIVKTVLFHDVTYKCLPFSKISYNLEIRPFFAYTVPSSLQRQDRLSCDPDFLLFPYYLRHAIQNHRF